MDKKTKEVIAYDLHESLKGKLDESKIEAAKKVILSATTSYPVSGAIVSGIFYAYIGVDMKDRKEQFRGHAGGFFGLPGGGGFWGDLYTDDIDRLFRNTVSFETHATVVYFSITFFDKDHNALGSVQSGSFTNGTIGVGGGTGTWFIPPQ